MTINLPLGLSLNARNTNPPHFVALNIYSPPQGKTPGKGNRGYGARGAVNDILQVPGFGVCRESTRIGVGVLLLAYCIQWIH